MTSLQVPDPAQRRDLAVFTERVLRLDEAAVVRLRVRADGLVGAWAPTGLDVLAARVVGGALTPPDVTVAADALARGLAGPGPGVDAGLPMDSAWRGALPPETGFVHLDDVPASVFADLARRGSQLARDSAGPHGPPPSLLDQDVLEVAGGGTRVGIPMRCVLALTAMGFAGDGADEVVRVRATPVWLRVDGRYGSVFRSRQKGALTLGAV